MSHHNPITPIETDNEHQTKKLKKYLSKSLNLTSDCFYPALFVSVKTMESVSDASMGEMVKKPQLGAL
jgi:hypothetical protein